MPEPKLLPVRTDPDDCKGSLEDDADEQVVRLQVPFRGRGPNAFEAAAPGPEIDSLPGECGEHGEHSGEDLKKSA